MSEKVESAEPPLVDRHLNAEQQQRNQNELIIEPSGSQQRAPTEQATVENGNSESKFASNGNNQNTINTPEPPPVHTSQTTNKALHETPASSATSASSKSSATVANGNGEKKIASKENTENNINTPQPSSAHNSQITSKALHETPASSATSASSVSSATVANGNGEKKFASKENTENNISTPRPPPAHTSQTTSKTSHETAASSATSASSVPLSLVMERPHLTSHNHHNEPQLRVVTLPFQRVPTHSGYTNSLPQPYTTKKKNVPTMSSPLEATSAPVQTSETTKPSYTPAAPVKTRAEERLDTNSLPQSQSNKATKNQLKCPLVTPKASGTALPKKQDIMNRNRLSCHHCTEVSVNQAQQKLPQYTQPPPQYVEPSQQYTQPPPQYVEQSLQYVKPSPQYTQPPPQYVEPSQQYVKPSPQYTQPPPQHVKPSRQYTQPPPQYVEPSLQYMKPSPQYTQPPPQYVKPSPQYTQPPPQYVEPSLQYVKPPPQYTQPSPQYRQPYVPFDMLPYVLQSYPLSTAGQYFSAPTSLQGFTTSGGYPNYSLPQPRTGITVEEQNWLNINQSSQLAATSPLKERATDAWIYEDNPNKKIKKL